MKIIIAQTDISALLKTADNIITKYGRSEIPEKIKGQTFLSVLKNMTQRSTSFSVCAIRDLAKMNEVDISAEHWEFFNSLHCINWEDMHPDTKEYLVAILVEYFRGNIVMSNTSYEHNG